ncbi:methionyl-tRNA formyltransferase [Mesomycoplasma molare]|uniref:Methionyl-tRNA formyltransferase n=1 Tax=Mesomycoplasma molare TaxID=171288 RepID=A0ABY5TUM3_9BACT|nr:methionyl-tRNA formyltransferase [Mesomycoplasma molare]UWD34275.1 methionyl-tRNA formyltransferase [Mesomycoplasma molare]
MKIVLAGTPEFSVPIFEEIINNLNVVAIISQPDKPANRGYKVIPTPVKELAQKYNIKLFQPNKISEIKEELEKLEYDILVTAAFGQWIPDSVLKIAKIASVNIHGSILPKYRGAAPIQHSLLNGDKETGITLIYMVKEMDAGDMLAKAYLKIEEEDTSKELFEKLSNLAKENIVDWLKKLYNNQLSITQQQHSEATLAPKIEKSFSQVFLTDDYLEVYKKIKALNENPGAFILTKENKRLKLFRASLNFVKSSIKLNFKNGDLYIYEYQYEGKKKINVKSQ